MDKGCCHSPLVRSAGKTGLNGVHRVSAFNALPSAQRPLEGHRVKRGDVPGSLVVFGESTRSEVKETAHFELALEEVIESGRLAIATVLTVFPLSASALPTSVRVIN